MLSKFKLFREESGQATILLAVVVAALIGFCAIAVDAGNLEVQKNSLQNAADAACLAGAKELPDNPDQADTMARAYAVTNGKTGDTVTVTIPADNSSIRVNIERTAPLYFAKIFGKNTSNMSANATASIGVAASVPWIVPFVIPKPAAFNYDHVYVMRMYGAGPYPNGYSYPNDYKNNSVYKNYPISNPYPYEFDYMNVKISANSDPNQEFSDYLNYLQYGYHQTFSVNQQMLYYAPSSGGQQSVDTFQKRITADSNTDYTKAKIGDARVMLIPIVANLLPRNTSENTKVTIIGFVGFYLQAVHKNSYGTSFWFEGRFLKDLNIGSGEVSFDPNADFGLRVIKLTN